MTVDMAYLGAVCIIGWATLPAMALLMLPAVILGRFSQTGGELLLEIAKLTLTFIHRGLLLYVEVLLILAALGIQTNRIF
jgi:hypothetical protein